MLMYTKIEHMFRKGGIHMSNEEYIECIVKMLQQIKDNNKLKIIFEYIQRIFI